MEGAAVELTSWRQLSDRGPDLVLCLDFAGGQAPAGFAALAGASLVDSCFLHIRQTSLGHEPGVTGQLDAHARRWAREALETGRPVSAVLGNGAGSAPATAVADVLAAEGPVPPVVILFDAMAVTGAVLRDEFTAAVESCSEHLTADELGRAHRWSGELVDTYPDDLPRLATELADRYHRLMLRAASGSSGNGFFPWERAREFTTHLAHLLLASQGGLDMRAGTPLFLSSRDHEIPVDARNISLDVGRAELLHDVEVIKLVADMLRGAHMWCVATS